MSKKVKILAIASMFAFLVTVVAPVGNITEAATTITIKNNGADSTNKVKVKKAKNDKKKKLKQQNQNRVKNNIVIKQDTGWNEANKNTTNGGNVDVTSGDTESKVTNKTTTNGNEAPGEDCGCVNDSELNLKITGNGADSTNKIKVTLGNGSEGGVYQSNYSYVSNSIKVVQSTGDNSANKNTTNGGDIDVDSGDATSTVNNTTTLGGNSYN